MRRTIIYLIIILTSSLLISEKTFASNTAHLLVIPSKQEITAKQDEKTIIRITFYNQSDSFISGTLKIVDFIVSDDTGAPHFLEAKNDIKSRYSAKDWISTISKQLTIPAQDHIEVVAYISIPPNATPGGHYAAAIFEPIKTTDIEQTTAPLTSMRLASLISIVVPGEIIEKASIQNLSFPGFLEYGPVPIQALITSDGNSHIRTQVTFSLLNMFGDITDKTTTTTRAIFPGSSRKYHSSLGKKYLLGRYKIIVFAQYNGGQAVIKEEYLWIIPWRLITIIIVLLLIIFMCIKKTYKHYYQLDRKANLRKQRDEETNERLKKIAKTRE